MRSWRRIVGWCGLVILTATLTISCGLTNSQPPATSTPDSIAATDCRSISHEGGETEICGQPQNVVVFGMHNLGLLLSLDVQPVGFAMEADPIGGEVFDNPAQQIPYLGDRLTTQPANLGSRQQPSLEKLSATAPDLIVGHWNNIQDYELLAQIAPTLIVRNANIKDQWQDNLRAIAQAVGKEEQAEAEIAQHDAKVAETRAAIAAAVQTHPKLLVIGTGSLKDTIFTISGDSYLGSLLEAVGFELVTPPTSEGQSGAPISLEILPELDSEADSIILLGYNQDLKALTQEIQEKAADQSLDDLIEAQQLQSIQTSWQENVITQNLTASQEDRVYFASYARWGLLSNSTGAELVLAQLQQFFANN